jgi:hypothetical protein
MSLTSKPSRHSRRMNAPTEPARGVDEWLRSKDQVAGDQLERMLLIVGHGPAQQG